MSKTPTKNLARKRRHARVLAKVNGTNKRPRLYVYRSNTHTYAQLINDTTNQTLASASDMKIKKGTKVEKAGEVGKEIANLAKEKKITEVVFDRGGYRYHGRVKAVAEAAREAGLKF